MDSKTWMDWEDRFGAHNYHPLPVVLTRGEGARVWDADGKEYIDFLSAYSAVNQGHCHPKLVKAMQEQAAKLTLTSRAFHHDLLGPFCKKMTEVFGYDRVLPMNTGVEAVETALKLARRWGYERKRIAADQALILVFEGNFHGRTMAAISASTSPDSRASFGPYLSGLVPVPYGDLAAAERAIAAQPERYAGVLVEPIQGEAGVVVPPEGFLKGLRSLCTREKVLLIADEVQTGLGRTGKLIACEHEGVRPDLLVLGKALSGGMMPVSAVLADDDVMLTLKPGEHGSTFGGNPLACRVAMAAIDVILDEALMDRAQVLGNAFRTAIAAAHLEAVEQVRGKGLLSGVVMSKTARTSAYEICLELMRRGILAKQTRDHIIRFAPPLVIEEAAHARATQTIIEVIRKLA